MLHLNRHLYARRLTPGPAPKEKERDAANSSPSNVSMGHYGGIVILSPKCTQRIYQPIVMLNLPRHFLEVWSQWQNFSSTTMTHAQVCSSDWRTDGRTRKICRNDTKDDGRSVAGVCLANIDTETRWILRNSRMTPIHCYIVFKLRSGCDMLGEFWARIAYFWLA